MTHASDATARFDLIIRNGRVVDPSQGVDDERTLYVRDGRFASAPSNTDAATAKREIDATGKLVVPGLVDLHTHCYWGGTPLGVNADKIGPATGVTTWVDTGSAGTGNFEGFYHHVITRSKVRIYPFLHISHLGVMPAGGLYLPSGELFDFRMMSFHEIVRVGEAFRPAIKGIKVRASVNATGSNSIDALKIARHAADALETRLMVHIGPPPPFIEDVLGYMRAGDIITHCYTPYHGGIVDHRLKLKACVLEARDRGVLFDVGHGSGSFSFQVAEQAMQQGFLPDAISSDIHSKCVNGPVFDLPTTMSKFVAMGMSLGDVVARTTHLPAAAIGEPELGTLQEGNPADIAIFSWERADLTLRDAQGDVRRGDRKLTATTTFVDGQEVKPIDDGRQEVNLSGPFPSRRAR